MAASKTNPISIAVDIREVLKDRGSAKHAKDVQWFFKEEIKSHGWYTAALRKAAVRCRRELAREHGMPFVIRVADELFSGEVLEEKVFATFLLENQTGSFGDEEFDLFTSWLDRIGSWADHDGLVHYLIAPMVLEKPSRSKEVFRWAKASSRWKRRAACVALIRGVREKKFFRDTVRLTAMLINDQDDMVQKGLGWLLRETAKYDAKKTVPYLMTIREKAPRLVLRTACETLPAATRKRILA
jgi:3-methyladenine DNA glycosylase AlkD